MDDLNRSVTLTNAEWELVKLALSEVCDPSSTWPGSQKLQAAEVIEAIREALTNGSR